MNFEIKLHEQLKFLIEIKTCKPKSESYEGFRILYSFLSFMYSCNASTGEDNCEEITFKTEGFSTNTR